MKAGAVDFLTSLFAMRICWMRSRLRHDLDAADSPVARDCMVELVGLEPTAAIGMERQG